jgi:N-acetylneuraminic acid mutarotase
LNKKLLGTTWTDFPPNYPFIVRETQGAMIENDIIIVSGFTNRYANATNQTFARDVTGVKGTTWRAMDALPVPLGITHGAFTVVGTKLYMCGGFYGSHPGRHIPDCFVYDHSKQPGQGQQWSRMKNLPGRGSGGAGMVYDSTMNALYYAAGGERNVPDAGDIDDVDIFYMYSFNNPSAGWVNIGPSPIAANHVSFVTAYDKSGIEHHYFLGGQAAENECTGNLDKVYEWNAVSATWTRRANTPFPRGHAPSSTLPISCGFVMAGGSINTPTGCYRQTSDISYYDIEADQWTSIGTLSKTVNAPVCAIGRDGYFYHVSEKTFNRRSIIVPA